MLGFGLGLGIGALGLGLKVSYYPGRVLEGLGPYETSIV